MFSTDLTADAASTPEKRKTPGILRLEDAQAIHHIDLPTKSTTRVLCNVFTPGPQLAVICGQSSSGKTIMAFAIAMKHANAGGAVCIIEPYRLETISPRGGSAERLLGKMRSAAGERLTLCTFATLSERFGSFTNIVGGSGEIDVPDLGQFYDDVRQRLHPFSLVIVDEPYFHLLERNREGEHERVAEALRRIVNDGHTILFLTQTMIDRNWMPLEDLVGKGLVIFTRLAHNAFREPTAETEHLTELSKRLVIYPKESGEYFIGGASTDATMATLRLDDIRIAFPQ